MGTGIGMYWHPGSRSHNRSHPSRLHPAITDSSLTMPPIATAAPTTLPTPTGGSLTAECPREGPGSGLSRQPGSGSGRSESRKACKCLARTCLCSGMAGGRISTVLLLHHWPARTPDRKVVQPQHVVSSKKDYSNPSSRSTIWGGFGRDSGLLVSQCSTFVCSTLDGDCDCETILEACAQHEP